MEHNGRCATHRRNNRDGRRQHGRIHQRPERRGTTTDIAGAGGRTGKKKMGANHKGRQAGKTRQRRRRKRKTETTEDETGRRTEKEIQNQRGTGGKRKRKMGHEDISRAAGRQQSTKDERRKRATMASIVQQASTVQQQRRKDEDEAKPKQWNETDRARPGRRMQTWEEKKHIASNARTHAGQSRPSKGERDSRKKHRCEKKKRRKNEEGRGSERDQTIAENKRRKEDHRK